MRKSGRFRRERIIIRKEREKRRWSKGTRRWMQNLSTGYPRPIWWTHEQRKYPVREAKKSWPRL